MVAGRLKELLKKYGKVGIGVHCSVSAVSVTGLYIAIRNNVDVESMLEKVGLPNLAPKDKDSKTSDLSAENPQTIGVSDSGSIGGGGDRMVEKERNKTTELVASSGGALALAVLLNKALFPIRVPITLAVTPAVARFLARHNIIKNSV